MKIIKTILFCNFSLLFLLLFFGCSVKEEKPVSLKKSEIVEIQINWKYHNLDAEMQLHEIKAQRPTELWETKSVKDIDSAPLGQSIPSQKLYISPGDKKRFVLAVKNRHNNPVFFFAAPHHVHPAQLSLGFKFKCLCINHAFKIMPQETWYRVVELSLNQNFLGDKISITHDLIGIEEAQMKDFDASSKEHNPAHHHEM